MNIANNDAATQFIVTEDPPSSQGAKFEVLVANILKAALVPWCETLMNLVKPGGTILLSGISHEQTDEIIELYITSGFEQLHVAAVEAGWALVSRVRSPSPSPQFPTIRGDHAIPTPTTASPPPTAARSPFPATRLPLNGVNHYLRDTRGPHPAAPVVVLMHGFTGSSEAWDQVAPVLFAKGVRAIALDRVGFGRTERPQQPTLPHLPAQPGTVGDFIATILEAEKSPSHSPSSAASFSAILNVIKSILPSPRSALATAIRRPSTTAHYLTCSTSRLLGGGWTAGIRRRL